MSKQIDIIIDLLTEFDEMGFIPTTAVPDPEAYAIKWREKITKAFEDYHKQSDSEWISVEDRLPEAEKEVLILAVRRYKRVGAIKEVPIITTAWYEDGTISTEDSEWNWYDIDFIYEDENDVSYIPQGWWEYRHYNPDDVYNNEIDDEVTHWMYLPEPPKGE